MTTTNDLIFTTTITALVSFIKNSKVGEFYLNFSTEKPVIFSGYSTNEIQCLKIEAVNGDIKHEISENTQFILAKSKSKLLEVLKNYKKLVKPTDDNLIIKVENNHVFFNDIKLSLLKGVFGLPCRNYALAARVECLLNCLVENFRIIPAKVAYDVFKKMEFATPVNDIRSWLNCIYFEDKNAYATNGYVAHRQTINENIEGGFYITSGLFKHLNKNCEGSIIIGSAVVVLPSIDVPFYYHLEYSRNIIIFTEHFKSYPLDSLKKYVWGRLHFNFKVTNTLLSVLEDLRKQSKGDELEPVYIKVNEKSMEITYNESTTTLTPTDTNLIGEYGFIFKVALEYLIGALKATSKDYLLECNDNRCLHITGMNSSVAIMGQKV